MAGQSFIKCTTLKDFGKFHLVITSVWSFVGTVFSPGVISLLQISGCGMSVDLFWSLCAEAGCIILEISYL